MKWTAIALITGLIMAAFGCGLGADAERARCDGRRRRIHARALHPGSPNANARAET